jgi:hypothetical protein
MSCPGLHCDGCGGGGGGILGAVLALIVIGVVVTSATFERIISDVVHLILYAMIGSVALAVTAGVTYAVVVARRRRRVQGVIPPSSRGSALGQSQAGPRAIVRPGYVLSPPRWPDKPAVRRP